MRVLIPASCTLLTVFASSDNDLFFWSLMTVKSSVPGFMGTSSADIDTLGPQMFEEYSEAMRGDSPTVGTAWLGLDELAHTELVWRPYSFDHSTVESVGMGRQTKALNITVAMAATWRWITAGRRDFRNWQDRSVCALVSHNNHTCESVHQPKVHLALPIRTPLTLHEFHAAIRIQVALEIYTQYPDGAKSLLVDLPFMVRAKLLTSRANSDVLVPQTAWKILVHSIPHPLQWLNCKTAESPRSVGRMFSRTDLTVSTAHANTLLREILKQPMVNFYTGSRDILILEMSSVLHAAYMVAEWPVAPPVYQATIFEYCSMSANQKTAFLRSVLYPQIHVTRFGLVSTLEAGVALAQAAVYACAALTTGNTQTMHGFVNMSHMSTISYVMQDWAGMKSANATFVLVAAARRMRIILLLRSWMQGTAILGGSNLKHWSGAAIAWHRFLDVEQDMGTCIASSIETFVPFLINIGLVAPLDRESTATSILIGQYLPIDTSSNQTAGKTMFPSTPALNCKNTHESTYLFPHTTPEGIILSNLFTETLTARIKHVPSFTSIAGIIVFHYINPFNKLVAAREHIFGTHALENEPDALIDQMAASMQEALGSFDRLTPEAKEKVTFVTVQHVRVYKLLQIELLSRRLAPSLHTISFLASVRHQLSKLYHQIPAATEALITALHGTGAYVFYSLHSFTVYLAQSHLYQRLFQSSNDDSFGIHVKSVLGTEPLPHLQLDLDEWIKTAGTEASKPYASLALQALKLSPAMFIRLRLANMYWHERYITNVDSGLERSARNVFGWSHGLVEAFSYNGYGEYLDAVILAEAQLAMLCQAGYGELTALDALPTLWSCEIGLGYLKWSTAIFVSIEALVRAGVLLEVSTDASAGSGRYITAKNVKCKAGDILTELFSKLHELILSAGVVATDKIVLGNTENVLGVVAADVPHALLGIPHASNLISPTRTSTATGAQVICHDSVMCPVEHHINDGSDRADRERPIMTENSISAIDPRPNKRGAGVIGHYIEFGIDSSAQLRHVDESPAMPRDNIMPVRNIVQSGSLSFATHLQKRRRTGNVLFERQTMESSTNHGIDHTRTSVTAMPTNIFLSTNSKIAQSTMNSALECEPALSKDDTAHHQNNDDIVTNAHLKSFRNPMGTLLELLLAPMDGVSKLQGRYLTRSDMFAVSVDCHVESDHIGRLPRITSAFPSMACSVTIPRSLDDLLGRNNSSHAWPCHPPAVKSACSAAPTMRTKENDNTSDRSVAEILVTLRKGN